MAQLRSIITGKLRSGAKAGKGASAPVAPRGTEWSLQEAILGALLDDAENAYDNIESMGVCNVLDGDFALATVAIMRHGAGPEALVDMPASLREFVAERLVASLHEPAAAVDIIRSNVNKLFAMQKRSRQEDLLQELAAAEVSGDSNKLARVMGELDALGRR